MLEIRYKTSQKKYAFKKVENVLAIQPLLAGSSLVRVKETDPERYEVVSIEPALYYGIFRAVNTTGNVEAIGYLDTNVGGAIMWEEVSGNFLLVNYPAYKQICQLTDIEPADFATYVEKYTTNGLLVNE
ncbi:hypothetical protein GGR92_003640 [Spirosoma lacussanchae]|uniref:hypothetical protein n=1 Tax=Spirosoma lacussanchae TaxID=1884249 RepID=UPI00110862F4|nr:hypothetical protein [Spirosoma lacussanchae]